MITLIASFVKKISPSILQFKNNPTPSSSKIMKLKIPSWFFREYTVQNRLIKITFRSKLSLNRIKKSSVWVEDMNQILNWRMFLSVGNIVFFKSLIKGFKFWTIKLSLGHCFNSNQAAR